MSQLPETTESIQPFSGLSMKDSAEIPYEIKVDVRIMLDSIVNIVASIEKEGFNVDLDVIPRFLEEDQTIQIGVFEKQSPYFGLHALLSSEINQEQLSALSEQERVAFTLFLESLTKKRVSSSYILLERKLKEFSTFLFLRGLKINNPSNFVLSLSNGVAQIQSRKS